MIKKIGYSFLIVGYLTSSRYEYATQSDEVYQIAAYIAFFEIVFFIIMPYNIKKQYVQFIILIFALLTTYYLLIAPWILHDTMISHIIAMFVLFGLALVSIVIQYCFDIYKIVPVDLYGTGMKVIVEDPALVR